MKKWTWRTARIVAALLPALPLLLALGSYLAVYGTVRLYTSGLMLWTMVFAAALLFLPIIWLTSLLLRHARTKISILFGVSLVVVTLELSVMPSSTALVVRGFMDRCLRENSLGTLRELAIAAHPRVAAARVSPEARFGLSAKDNASLPLRTRFKPLNWMGGAESINEKDQVISIWWGETFSHVTGRWGVLVGVDGQPVAKSEPAWTLYPVAPDVAFVIDRS